MIRSLLNRWESELGSNPVIVGGALGAVLLIALLSFACDTALFGGAQ